ncbi:GntR family transcriptional regulator [Marinivivus vitaminiproducens]|uniref:GntR family transcriptional regulator n=1 Tax=Marinivivus vitaminiproducens TaxID=3035935 RepID=UPI0027AABF23|nr:GntR family transcriptional regulator [Geminicoccaceae bacterium SCSIO 64248]
MHATLERKDRDPVSLVDKAYAWLKNRIVTDLLPAGADIDDAAVALELGMSRTPVRDAIRLLHAQGYVDVLPRKATRVAFLQVRDMRHVYQLITALEVKAVSLIAARAPGEAGVSPLRQACAAMRAVDADGGGLAEWHAADEHFHRGLLELSGNPWITRVGLEHRDFVQRAHLVALRLRNVTATSTVVHAELVDLLAAGDVAGATANHLAQRNRMEDDLIGAVERAGLRAL